VRPTDFTGAAATLVRVVVAVAVVWAVYWAPTFVLLRVAHVLPSHADPRLVELAARTILLGVVFALFRVPVRVIGLGRESTAGARAAFWLVLGTFLVSLLVSVTIVSTSDAAKAGFTVGNAIARWRDGFPVTGLAGRFLFNAIFGPVFEEMLFRVLILGFLLRAARPVFALSISTLLFAAGHGSWLLSGLLGLAFGLLYLRFRGLWVCAAAHGAHNLVSASGAPLLVAYLHEAGLLMPVGPHLLVIQLAWFIVSLACFAMFLRQVLAGTSGGQLLLLPKPSPLEIKPTAAS
jgi:membrane protease YdiL (CAAX protease family)